jgi:hypothetical protein
MKKSLKESNKQKVEVRTVVLFVLSGAIALGFAVYQVCGG